METVIITDKYTQAKVKAYITCGFVCMHTLTHIRQLINTINDFRVLNSSNWRSARQAIATFFYGIGFHVEPLWSTRFSSEVSSIQIRFLFISFHFIFFSLLASRLPIAATIWIQIEFKGIDNFSALFISFAHLTDCHFQKWHRTKCGVRKWAYVRLHDRHFHGIFAKRCGMVVYVYNMLAQSIEYSEHGL